MQFLYQLRTTLGISCLVCCHQREECYIISTDRQTGLVSPFKYTRLQWTFLKNGLPCDKPSDEITDRLQFSLAEASVQFSSVAQPCPTLCNPVGCSMPGCPFHHQHLLKLMSTESVMPSNHLILWLPLLLLPSIFPSIRVFSNESVLRIRWPKYWSFSFSFSISPSNEYSGLISFRMDCLDLLAVQGTLKSLLQHRSLKASILWHSALFMVHIHIWLLEKPQLWLDRPVSAK